MGSSVPPGTQLCAQRCPWWGCSPATASLSTVVGVVRRFKRGPRAPGEMSGLSSGGRAVCVPGSDTVGEFVSCPICYFVVQALRLTLQPVQPVALTPFSATRNEATLSEFWIIPILNKSCELFLNFELFKFWINPVKFFLNFELFCIFWIILELLKFWIFPVNYFWILKYSNFE